MKNIILNALIVIIAIVGIILGILGGFSLSALQLETLKLVSMIAGCAALYCFLAGEISRNNSQMDKLWSILPEVYLWIVAIKSNMNPRVILMASLITLWGIRLTINFGRKGAYSLKFWSGEEDYRWLILRQNKYFKSKFVWAIFDLLFISVYQNFIVLAITFPAIALMESSVPLGIFDVIISLLLLAFLILETIADEQQWKFHSKKKKLLLEGKKLEELPTPYNKGFNTIGLWSCSRHPNYLGEQSIWICLYLFCISAKISGFGIFNWSIIGCMLLLLLFLGSSSLGEGISSGKYPEYTKYQKNVSKYIPVPWKKYN